MTIGDIERSPASELAAQHGLTPIGRQPSLVSYTASIWERRHFLLAFARSHLQADNSESRLGQLWQVLNPLLNAAVYYLVFGVIFESSKKIDHFLAFLVTGVFIFAFTQRTIQSGAKAITSNIGLVRALHFPRAVLPLATSLEEFLRTGTSLLVLALIVLGTGEPLGWSWLQMPVVIALQLVFSIGIAFVFARLTAAVRDVAQFLPFAMRIWMYLSGVMYSVTTLTDKFGANHEWAATLLTINPASIYIELSRGALLADHPAAGWYWYAAVAWAVIAFVLGFIFFWRGENSYGRG